MNIVSANFIITVK